MYPTDPNYDERDFPPLDYIEEEQEREIECYLAKQEAHDEAAEWGGMDTP